MARQGRGRGADRRRGALYALKVSGASEAPAAANASRFLTLCLDSSAPVASINTIATTAPTPEAMMILLRRDRFFMAAKALSCLLSGAIGQAAAPEFIVNKFLLLFSG